MKVLKAVIIIEGEPGLAQCDLIRHANRLWLVPEWLKHHEPGLMQPERIIRLDRLRYQKVSEKGQHLGQYLVQEPIPKAVLYDDDPPSAGGKYVVQMTPDVFLKVSDTEG